MKAKEMIEAKITELTAKLKEGFPIGAPYMEDEVAFFQSLLAAIDEDAARLDYLDAVLGTDAARILVRNVLCSSMTVREAIDAHRKGRGDG